MLAPEQQRAKKQFADANTTLHQFIDKFPKHELITTAWMGVAANLESLGKTDEALSTYQRLATEYPQSFNAPLALLAEIPLLKAKNRTEEARRVCETIISQYRDSIVDERSVQGIDDAADNPSRRVCRAPAADVEVAIQMERPPEPATAEPKTPAKLEASASSSAAATCRALRLESLRPIADLRCRTEARAN